MVHWLAALPVLIWVYLLIGRGAFWRIGNFQDPRVTAQHPDIAGTAQRTRRVIALVPARDEAATIGSSVASLLEQEFDGELQVIVIDDGSRDDTAALARAVAAQLGAAAKLTVLSSTALPAGWTGKLWALAQGVRLASERAADYLLFSDADILHRRDNVAQLLARAEVEQRDLVSYMVQLSVDSFAERCLIPAFVFFFFKLYPPHWIASSCSATAGAAGGCVLIRPRALERIGGLEAIRAQVIDDCALATAVKQTGGRLWLGLTRSASSLRRYGSFGEIGRMISRTAFNQLHHSYLLLAATLLGLAVTYLAAPLLLLSHDPVAIALGASAWLLMSLCYLPMVRFYRLAPLWAISLPAIGVFYAGATLHSALQYRLGRGGVWKGRVQDVRAGAARQASAPTARN